jgi:hypothetical protein
MAPTSRSTAVKHTQPGQQAARVRAVVLALLLLAPIGAPAAQAADAVPGPEFVLWTEGCDAGRSYARYLYRNDDGTVASATGRVNGAEVASSPTAFDSFMGQFDVSLAGSPAGAVVSVDVVASADKSVLPGSAGSVTVPACADNGTPVGGSEPSVATPVVMPPLDTRPTPAVMVKAINKKSKLWIDVNPNKGSGYWRLEIQKLGADGLTWSRWKVVNTQGKKETRKVNPKKGTYRVIVFAKYGHQGAESSPVTLTR